MTAPEGYRLRSLRRVTVLVDRLAWPIVIICFLLAAVSVGVAWKNLVLRASNKMKSVGMEESVGDKPPPYTLPICHGMNRVGQGLIPCRFTF